MKKSLIAAVLAFSSLPFVAEARPDANLVTSHIEVPYGDLNLSHPAGASMMLTRIKQAATRVCGGHPDSRDLRSRAAFKLCVRAAVNEALRQLNAPLVTALHTGADPRVVLGSR
jgi:UrcA family protein